MSACGPRLSQRQNIQNDVRRTTYDTYIHIYRENPLFNSPVWGSLTLTPITTFQYITFQYITFQYITFQYITFHYKLWENIFYTSDTDDREKVELGDLIQS